MGKKQLSRLLLFFLFAICLSTGCAHRPATFSRTVSEDLQTDQNRQITTADTVQTPQNTGSVDSSDEDFFDEEFEEEEDEQYEAESA